MEAELEERKNTSELCSKEAHECLTKAMADSDMRLQQQPEEETSHTEQERLREELVRYLAAVRGKKEEDGLTPAVIFPRNFDTVVSLMGKDDLQDHVVSPSAALASDVPWSHYMLRDGLDRDSHYARYRGLFAEEQSEQEKIQRGLAKIKQLDLRLQQLRACKADRSRRPVEYGLWVGPEEEGEERAPDQPTPLGDEGVAGISRGERAEMTDGANQNEVNNKSGHNHGTPRSVASSELYYGSESGMASSEASAGVRSRSSKAFLTQRFNTRAASSRAASTVAPSHSTTQARTGNEAPKMPGKTKLRKQKGRDRDFVEENVAKATKTRSSRLSVQQEMFVADLLEESDDGERWRELERYGCDEAEEARLREIDTCVQQLRSDDLQPMASLHLYGLVEPATQEKIVEPGEGALRETRSGRLEVQRSNQIESALQQCTQRAVTREEVAKVIALVTCSTNMSQPLAPREKIEALAKQLLQQGKQAQREGSAPTLHAAVAPETCTV
ncbi:unnamed protein product [Chrysoparadoxa australica]